ncbi:hypothetical protein PtrSN002B_011177 [Pyrenophora tritici-repentis]|uniref:DUF936 domain containing protein n=2 Tax=Pyrenophora tritici-repentis TaxID=45151 RepID=A0A2W1DV90_9PLEO|nr:uncharacterized protein PTRG_09079 [Pyrenophora tritici-repentis Pt-1C-BFP]KAA8627665.1 hypothetical protein PtrV1_03345 [Pyrenophora tritici-repentis]EDU42130.1 hypothetical protein PTRG_09079 [Pyrenophora tritici-repentis Pt-1C-BFP]KAF7442304.1 hypothetical protein A1F99_131730 [Pyrenophora tritici-repentis]KAF7579323.1 DUF936 domain containing protein [Pyrenophora tritici-repentis]KAG9378247.1 hypothetical protein A1F94_011363 [Pyrenophora tritici-repentis]
MDNLADIEQIVHDLKVDRDTWHAVALQYRAAFEAQTTRLSELQDVCFATQAELENERVQQRRLQVTSNQSENYLHSTFDGAGDHKLNGSFGTAAILSPRRNDNDRTQKPSDGYANPLFKRVQECAAQKNYGTALVEVERLLRGPLSSKARAEGLLLKSNVLRASGPEELFDALAACSEAVELCDRISELETFLPRIQYQRGLLYQELRMLRDDKEVASTVSDDGLLSTEASDFRKSKDDDLDLLRFAKRRSGFDENRTMEGLLARLEEKEFESKRRRVSTQLRQRAAAKARRMSLPYRWVKSKSEEYHLV